MKVEQNFITSKLSKKMKTYSRTETAKILGLSDGRIRAMFIQDKKESRKNSRFPTSYKCECGAWRVTQQDIDKIIEKKNKEKKNNSK